MQLPYLNLIKKPQWQRDARLLTGIHRFNSRLAFYNYDKHPLDLLALPSLPKI